MAHCRAPSKGLQLRAADRRSQFLFRSNPMTWMRRQPRATVITRRDPDPRMPAPDSTVVANLTHSHRAAKVPLTSDVPASRRTPEEVGPLGLSQLPAASWTQIRRANQPRTTDCRLTDTTTVLTLLARATLTVRPSEARTAQQPLPLTRSAGLKPHPSRCSAKNRRPGPLTDGQGAGRIFAPLALNGSGRKPPSGACEQRTSREICSQPGGS